MFEKQRQEAGDNSQQFQANTVIVQNGIDEKRAREIIDEKLHEVILGYTQEAHITAERRIRQFADDLIPKLVKSNLVDELKDPSIQILLGEAQKTAASTERQQDYALLSELLLHRIKKGSDRNIRAGISRAVKIVDEISDYALLGLTVAHAFTNFSPTTGNIIEGITVFENLFNKLIYDELPLKAAWLDHLDILDAIRVSQFGSFKNSNQYLSELFAGYIDPGIEKSSEDYQQALEIIDQSSLPREILCDHELLPGYSRLRLRNIKNIDFIIVENIPVVISGGKIVLAPSRIQISPKQKQALEEIYGLYSKESNLRDSNVIEFLRLWDTRDSLKKLRLWWDSIPHSFSITEVGRVLAQANAQRCDPSVPALNREIS